jgi:hypothetical protein
MPDAHDTRRRLEERRDQMRERVDELAKPPELGAAQGFGKRIGDGTVEAIRRQTDIGVAPRSRKHWSAPSARWRSSTRARTVSATPAAARSRRRGCRRCPTAFSV